MRAHVSRSVCIQWKWKTGFTHLTFAQEINFLITIRLCHLHGAAFVLMAYHRFQLCRIKFKLLQIPTKSLAAVIDEREWDKYCISVQAAIVRIWQTLCADLPLECVPIGRNLDVTMMAMVVVAAAAVRAPTIEGSSATIANRKHSYIVVALSRVCCAYVTTSHSWIYQRTQK